MQDLKKNLGYWLIKKGIRLSDINALDVYLLFNNNIERLKAKEHFDKFKAIKRSSWSRNLLSDDIKQIDPEAIKFIENNY